MVHARSSLDRWARLASHILDEARDGRGIPEDIDWALSYVGDLDRPKKIPAHLHGSGRWWPERKAA